MSLDRSVALGLGFLYTPHLVACVANGFVVDSGVLIGLAKHPYIGLRDQLEQMRRRGVRLVTIKEVFTECKTVPLTLVQQLGLLVERSEQPAGTREQLRTLEAFQGGEGPSRADRSVFAHAIARSMDILTTDNSMKERSYREFLRRLDRMPDMKLPAWRLPEIEVVRAYPHS
jgi:hypothetical protein